MEDQVFLARGYLERGNAQHAIGMLEKMHLVPENSDHLEALILLIEAYNEADKDSEALELARELLRLHPEDTDLQDCALHLFSAFRDNALEAEALALELKGKYPEKSYYSYMLAYLGHTWLSRGRDFVLEHLSEALRLSGGTYYLSTAFSIYHSYDMVEERAECVASMVEHSPQAYDTRRCLILEKLYTREYEAAAELGIELLMDYPQETWLTEKVEEVKDLLYGDRFDRLIQRAYWRIEKRIDDTNSRIAVCLYMLCFFLVFAVLAFFGLIFAPFFVVKFLVIDESLHIKRLETDALYRKLTEVSDIVQHIPGGLAFLLTEITNSQKLFLIDNERCIAADALRCSLRSLQYGVDPDALVNPKIYLREEIREIAIRETEFSLEFHNVTRMDKDFCFSSLEVPRRLREYLEQSGWQSKGERVQSKADIFGTCFLFVALIAALFQWEWPGQYGYELRMICAAVVFVNGLVYLRHRIRTPVVSEMYASSSA